MNYSLFIRPDALSDIEEAAKWYEEREPGLGAAFVRDIFEGIDRLPTNPLIHRQRDRRRNVRWFFPHKFPYRIYLSNTKSHYYGICSATFCASRQALETTSLTNPLH